MVEYAAKGLMAALNDPYSFYYSPEEFKDMWEDDEGNYTGIGVLISANYETQLGIISRVFKGRRMAGPTRCPFAQLVELRRRMDAYPRRLELRAVVYDELLDQRENPNDLAPVLELADSVTFWVWHAANMPKLPEYFRRYRAIAPGKRTYMGVYLWDFGGHRPMPDGALEMQLDMGLDLFRRGDIEGFVFLCSSICNRPLPTVAYVRRWLAEHGGEKRQAV